MQEPIHHYCRLGIVQGMAWPACLGGDGPVIESFTCLAADADFEVIEAGRINDDGIRREAIAIARQGGLEIVFAAQPTVLMRGAAPASLDTRWRTAASARATASIGGSATKNRPAPDDTISI